MPKVYLSSTEELVGAIEPLVATNVEDLVQTNKLGAELDFEEARPTFEKTLAVLRKLLSADLALASEAKIDALRERVTEVFNQFHKIRSFSAQRASQPTAERDALINGLDPIFDRLFDAVAGVLPLAQHGNVEQYEAEVKASAEKLKSFFEEQHQQSEAYKSAAEKEIRETLDKAKQAAQQAGIVQHETFFRLEANEHKKMARAWLATTVLLAVATGTVGWLNYSRTFGVLQAAASAAPQARASSNTALTIQLAIAKLIMFSILFSAVLWAGRIYRAHRHNYVVNKHRQNALATFEAFVKATEDTPTKNAVLLQATQCIFGPQSTGYLTQEKESEGPTQILEIFRGATSAKN
jgi:hypothetical protein